MAIYVKNVEKATLRLQAEVTNAYHSIMPPDEGSACTYGSWYLVHCQPRKEAYAARSLRQLLHLRVFLPQSQVRLRGEIRQTPFFPGYLFVLADLREVPLSSINVCPGVLRLVGFEGHPQPIPYAVIETIAHQLERLNEGGAPPYHPFNPGDAVRMKSGSLQELNMVFVGSVGPNRRVHVLLEFMGRLTEAQVDVDALEKDPEKVLAAALPLEWSKKRVRYTRGKGRRIHKP
ncbi:MAG TPA: transcription termination/antitermination NusG family protein [Ktedonobacteraceae bacterium]|nr:transcription termination/antitermination NusG family protein [Ktedonobacteraceae bacterium]